MLSALIPAIAWLFSTPLLLGLVEYYGAYLGNDVADVWVASGLILLLLARGFRAPRSSHGLSSALATAGLCLGVSSFFPLFLDAQSLLPPIWLKWISGALLVALGYFPLGWLGSHLSARTLTHGVGSWIAGSLGCFAGASAMTHWGLGVPGVLVSTTGLACVTALPIPEVRNFHTPGSQSSIKERAGFIFTLLGLFFAWQYALPLLGTFDQGSSLQVSRRIATLGALGIAGAWAIGGPISDSNKSAGWIAVLAAMCACALTRFEGHIEELSIQRTFQGLVSDPRLLNLLGLKEPIGQDHPLFVPFVTLVLAGLLAILSGALLRACAGQRMEGNGPRIAPENVGSTALATFGTTFLVSAAIPNQSADFLSPSRFGELGFFFLLTGAVFVLLRKPRQRPIQRLFLGSTLVCATVWGMGAPTQPATGYPFMDNFETRVAHSEAEIPTLGPRLRLLKRDASPQLGAWFLSSGRSRFALDGPQESWLSRAASMGMALSGLDQPRTLLTGLVHPALMNSIANPPALMNSSANHPSEFILAPLPMESADLIARAPGGTLADTLAKTSLQKASTEPFDLVFSYQPWHWSEKSSVFQECRIAMLAQSVRDGGVLVQAFDSGAINRAGIDAMLNSLKRMGLHSELLIVPNDWQRPGILLVSWESRPMLTRTALVRLKAHQWLGLPQDSKLLVLPRSQSSAHSLSSLLGPVTPTVRTFAEFEPRTIHELSSERRAADFLRTFLPGPSENEPPSFLGVLVAHLDAQVYHVNDTLPGVPVTEQLDLDEATVEALSNLTVAHGGTRFIRDLWTGMTHLLVEKRELNWIFNWLQPLANESDQAPLWNHPATLWAIGDAYQEIYEHDSALAWAERALLHAPDSVNTIILKARVLMDLQRPAEGLKAFEDASKQFERPPAPFLNGWAQAALSVGNEPLALSIAQSLLSAHGEDSMGPPLRSLLGLAPIELPTELKPQDHSTGPLKFIDGTPPTQVVPR